MADDQDADPQAGEADLSASPDGTALSDPNQVTPADEARSDLEVATQADQSPVPAIAQDMVAQTPAPPDQGPATTPGAPGTGGSGNQPAVVVNVNPAPQGTPAQPGSTKVGAATRGYSEPTMNAIGRDTAGPEAALQGDLDFARQAYESQTAEAEQNAEDIRQAQIRRNAAVALQAKYQSDGDAAISKEQAAWAEQEKIAQDQVNNTTRQYAAKMDADIARVQAMTVRDPIQTASPSVRRGLAMSAFAQGFLGAEYGIHIDAVGAINRAVDQDIRMQEERINRGEWLVGQDRELWQMARTEASDQAEARTRLRALKLGAMQADITAHVASVGTDLAKADGALALAKINSALADTKTQLTTAYYNRAVDIHQHLLSATIELARIATEYAKIDAEKKIAELTHPAPTLQPFVSPVDIDPKTGQPQVLGYLRPGADEQTRQAAITEAVKAARVARAADNYAKAAAKVGGRVIGGKTTRLDDDDVALLKAARIELVAATLGANRPGDRAGQQQWDTYADNLVPLPTETGASLAASVRAAYQAKNNALGAAQDAAVQGVVGPDGRPLAVNDKGVGGAQFLDSRLTAWPDPARPGALDYYTVPLASPADPGSPPTAEAYEALNSVYQVARGAGDRSDQKRAVDMLLAVATSDHDKVSSYLSDQAANYLLHDVNVRAQITRKQEDEIRKDNDLPPVKPQPGYDTTQVTTDLAGSLGGPATTPDADQDRVPAPLLAP